MSEGFDPNKTEAPTPRKREKAREEGQVVASPDLNAAISLLVIALAAIWLAPTMAAQLQSMLRTRLLQLDGSNWSIGATVISARWLVNHLWLITSGIVLGCLGLQMALAQLQSGFLMTAKPLSPNWERLDPVQGWLRLWSLDSAVRGLLAMVKVCTLIAITGTVLMLWRGRIVAGTQGSLGQSLHTGWDLLVQLMLWMAGLAFTWGALDYGFRWFRLEQKLRMSREEVKDEHKEEQGDPQLKGRMRRMQKEAAQRKSLKDVPRASVVITNPTHYAVALRYEAGQMKAPQVLAKGSGAFARRIADVAREHGIPVLERKPLTRALFALAKVGEEIPIEFYRAVAEILALVYRLKNPR
jgi:flagellar biosynthetic protein FlhB